jgi:DNA invertase Pin-like site-specific DNA recombinase
MLVGYARVSSTGQSLDVQLEQLRAAGAEKVFEEKASGRSANGRPELAACLDYVREGDTLIVTRLDRLARSMIDLHQIVERLQEKVVDFRCLQQAGVDTTGSMGRLVFGILAAVAEFENAIRKERQMEGIRKAQAAGVYSKRRGPRNVIPEQVWELHEKGMGATAIARRLGIGRTSVYRALKAQVHSK